MRRVLRVAQAGAVSALRRERKLSLSTNHIWSPGRQADRPGINERLLTRRLIGRAKFPPLLPHTCDLLGRQETLELNVV